MFSHFTFPPRIFLEFQIYVDTKESNVADWKQEKISWDVMKGKFTGRFMGLILDQAKKLLYSFKLETNYIR